MDVDGSNKDTAIMHHTESLVCITDMCRPY